jgi:putative SOS response-associated peptidase YedK
MCGRFALTADTNMLALRFSFASEKLLYGPKYNIAPGQEVLTVINGGEKRSGFVFNWRRAMWGHCRDKDSLPRSQIVRPR